MSTFDQMVAICKRRGIPLPVDLNNFGYSEAPRFHSIVIGTSCMDLTPAQCESVVDFAQEQVTTDCAPAIMRFADQLVG